MRPRPWSRRLKLPMRILIDHGTPSGIASALTPHQVTEARDRGWETLSNGDLLKQRRTTASICC
jgi:hypothetical protein